MHVPSKRQNDDFGISFTDLSGLLCVPNLGWLFTLRSCACFSWYCLTSSDTLQALVEGLHFPLCRGKLREVYMLIGHDSCHQFLGQRWQPKASWNQWICLWECFALIWQICCWCLLWAADTSSTRLVSNAGVGIVPTLPTLILLSPLYECQGVTPHLLKISWPQDDFWLVPNPSYKFIWQLRWRSF